MTIPKFSLKKNKELYDWTISHTTTVDSQSQPSPPVKSAHGFALQLFCLRDTFFSSDQISCLRKNLFKSKHIGGYLVQVPTDFFLTLDQWRRKLKDSIDWNHLWSRKAFEIWKDDVFLFDVSFRTEEGIVLLYSKFWSKKRNPWMTRQCALSHTKESADFAYFSFKKAWKPKGVDSKSDFSLKKMEPLQSIRDLGTNKHGTSWKVAF